MDKKGAFDYILLETTGLADPGNIAPLFWVDEGLGSTIYLDGIVTLVDAKNVLKSLDEPVPETIQHDDKDDHHGPEMTTAHLQISHADIIVLNKSDLVSETELEAVKARIQSINGLAKIHVTIQGAVPQLEGFLLDLHAYDDVGALDVATKGHSHLDPVCISLLGSFVTKLTFETISTVTVKVPVLEEDQLPALDAWLRSVLWDTKLPLPVTDSQSHGFSNLEIHRLKARLPLSNGQVKIVQGVREIFDILDAPNASTSDSPQDSGGKIVLIGRKLNDVPFERSILDTIQRR